MAGGQHLTSSAKRQQLTLPKRPIDRDRFNRAEELAESLAERLLLFRQPALQPLRLLKTKRFFGTGDVRLFSGGSQYQHVRIFLFESRRGPHLVVVVMREDNVVISSGSAVLRSLLDLRQ